MNQGISVSQLAKIPTLFLKKRGNYLSAYKERDLKDTQRNIQNSALNIDFKISNLVNHTQKSCDKFLALTL